MKKLMNETDRMVTDAMAGLEAAHADLIRVQFSPNIILRLDGPRLGKVALVSGGGSGHEPLHGGFVGYGMLDAACPGDIFTSPTPDQIEAATRAADGEAGVLYIVKNYTGDVMNFEMAAELCRDSGISIEMVLIDDDVAVTDSLYTAGRRGVGTTVFAEKLCGAAAEQGKSLSEVAELGRKVNRYGRSIGVALSSCTTPSAGRPTFDLGPDEMEFGIGIHGEPGRRRLKILSAQEIGAMMMDAVFSDMPLEPGDRVIAMVNGMGGTPLLELYLMYGEIASLCRSRGIQIARSLVGDYITSLEMQGCSVTLLKVDDELLSLWDAPVKTPALRW